MRMGRRSFRAQAGAVAVGFLVLMLVAACTVGPLAAQPAWSQDELAVLRSLALDALKPLPSDPSNHVADDPRAAALGERLFFDARFSGNGAVSCASCHMPEHHFTDARSFGVGMDMIPLNVMTLVGASYSPWQTWNGKNDSQWSQALIPLENPVEHGGNRTQYAHLIAENYADEYAALFGPLPDLSDAARFPRSAGPVDSPDASEAWSSMSVEDQETINQIFANMGKTLAAYERTLLPRTARFDRYVATLGDDGRVQGEKILTDEELAGLRIFIGKGQCTHCHNGPRFTNDSFHNTAIPGAPGYPIQRGRIDGIVRVQADRFNCFGPYSDAAPEECTALRFMVTQGDTLLGAMKTPTLRNVAETAPYMHTGEFATLADVIAHYNGGGFAIQGHNELNPLGLSREESAQLEAFLRTLTEEDR